MAEKKSLLEVVLMPLVLAVVGTVGTYLITQQRQLAAEAEAARDWERADIAALANRQVKILEIFADKIVSDGEAEQAPAMLSTLSLDPELAAKLLPTFSIQSDRSPWLQGILEKVANAIVLTRVAPVDSRSGIAGDWLLHRSIDNDRLPGALGNAMSIELTEPGRFAVWGPDWAGQG